MFRLRPEHILAFEQVADQQLRSICRTALQDQAPEFYSTLKVTELQFITESIDQARKYQLIYNSEIVEFVLLKAEFARMRRLPLENELVQILTYPNRNAERKFIRLRSALTT